MLLVGLIIVWAKDHAGGPKRIFLGQILESHVNIYGKKKKKKNLGGPWPPMVHE